MDKDPAKDLPFNGVFRYAGGKLTAAITDLPLPNGLGFSPDGKTFYVSNYGPHMFVRAYDVVPGVALGAPADVDLGFAEEGHTVYITASTSIYRLHSTVAGEMPRYRR
jgi:gluconolactonase